MGGRRRLLQCRPRALGPAFARTQASGSHESPVKPIGGGLQRGAAAVDRFEAFRGVAVVGRHFFAPRALLAAGNRSPAGRPGFSLCFGLNAKNRTNQVCEEFSLF